MAAAAPDLPAWYKEMEKELECPVCLVAFLDPPIYVCKNQHGLCSPCRTKLNDQGKPCPLCNGKLTDMRNLMMERLLDKLPKTKCIYPECSFKRADPQAVLDHQEDCSHRKAECGDCGEMWAMSILNQHLETQHDWKLHSWSANWKLRFLWVGQMMLKGPNSDPPLDHVVFYLNAITVNDSRSMLWLSYNGTKKNRRKYQFMIEVLSNEDPQKIVLSCTKFCVPCDVSREDVKERDLGVIINKYLAQEVNIGPDELKFNFNIQVFLAKSFV